MTKIQTPSFSLMAEKWSSPFVSRDQVGKLTGGIVNSRYLANLDCQGKGPVGRIRVGRKIAYPVNELVAWLERKSSAL